MATRWVELIGIVPCAGTSVSSNALGNAEPCPALVAVNREFASSEGMVTAQTIVRPCPLCGSKLALPGVDP